MPRLRGKSLVKSNLDLWLNNLFLKDGFFIDVSTGETDVYGRDISEMISSLDASYADGRVWQSAFKEWVHESGVIPTEAGVSSPMVASGVTVDGTFYPKDPGDPGFNPTFSHAIDFRNGRVIFDSPISLVSYVQGEFSYKEITVALAATFENETKEFYFETSYKDNPFQTGVIIFPEENSRTLPMVMIDVTQSSYDAYELGNASNTLELQGSLIVWARNDYTRDQIEDLIGSQEHVVALGIDFNTAPYPLDYRNDKNPLFSNYDTLANLASPYFWRRIYIDEIDSRRIAPFYNIERTQINFLIRVYPNF
jgi:hypothetical protein